MGISVGKSYRLHFPPPQLIFRGTQLAPSFTHSLPHPQLLHCLLAHHPCPQTLKSILLDIFSAFILYMLKKKKKNPHTMLQTGPTINSWPPILTELSMLPHLWEFPSSHSLQQRFHAEKTQAINRSHISTSLNLSSNHC